MSGLLVRPFAPADAPALGRLFHRAVHEGAARHYTQAQRAAWSPAPPEGAAWTARLADAVTMVAERDGAAIGFMSLVPDASYLDFAYVAPEAMGQGVSDALYAVIEGRARASGLARLEADASDVARSFFARHGWTFLRRQDVVRHGVTMQNSRMEKSFDRQIRSAA